MMWSNGYVGGDGGMNPVVLVTGASRGIGAATAKVFASHGYDVILNYYQSEDCVLKVKKEILDNYSVQVLLVKADVSLEEDVKEMMEKIDSFFGRLDVLVNNAGIALDSIFLDKSLKSFQKMLDVNLLGTFLVTKYARDLMTKGSIVNVSSTNSIDSYYPFSMEYDASKAGVNLLTKDFAVEFGPDIRVNAVAPGWILTEMNQDLSLDFISGEKEKIVLNRFGDPIEVANVIYFLASDEASYLNGVILPVDGGRR